MLAIKKISSKNQILPILSKIKNFDKIISSVVSTYLSIFSTRILVGRIEKPYLDINIRVMTLILLSKSIKVLIFSVCPL